MKRCEEIRQKADHLHTPGYAHNKIFVEAANWADKTMIERACEWLKLLTNLDEVMIEEFRNAMTE